MKRCKKYKFVITKAVIIIYGHSPLLLNVTGLKTKQEIEDAKIEIENRFGVKCNDIRIDNLFFSHNEKKSNGFFQRNKKSISLYHLYYFLKGFSPDGYFIDYHVEIFPGMFLKSTLKNLPTILFFSTGSYSIIGGKSFDSVEKAKVLVNKCLLVMTLF